MEISLNVVHPRAAGIDIGSEQIFVAVKGQSVRSFRTFTGSYHEAVEYLQREKVTTVAIEATGVYWIPLYDILEQAGIEVWLVNPYEVKNVPGRKSDVQDCQWLLQLHTFGLLRRCFVPEEAIREVRSYVRLRDDHIQMASSHILHMQKAFELMNIKLHAVISQLIGVSGRCIIEAILAGERRPEHLVRLCEKQILNHKADTVRRSLEGNYKQEYVFLLRQAYECWMFYQTKVHECDREIGQVLDRMTQHLDPPDHPSAPKPTRHHPVEVPDLHHKLLMVVAGGDPTPISGLTDESFLKAIAETGYDLARHWKTSSHFTSWLGLAPSKRAQANHTSEANDMSIHALGRSSNLPHNLLAKATTLLWGLSTVACAPGEVPW